MQLEQIKKIGKCCVTGKPLATSEYITMVQLQYQANWQFPTWGNIITGVSNMAVAYVHDDAIKDGSLTGPILYAIEVSGDEIIYHDIKKLSAAAQLN